MSNKEKSVFHDTADVWKLYKDYPLIISRHPILITRDGFPRCLLTYWNISREDILEILSDTEDEYRAESNEILDKIQELEERNNMPFSARLIKANWKSQEDFTLWDELTDTYSSIEPIRLRFERKLKAKNIIYSLMDIDNPEDISDWD